LLIGLVCLETQWIGLQIRSIDQFYWREPKPTPKQGLANKLLPKLVFYFFEQSPELSLLKKKPQRGLQQGQS
jgi:hypothetical protein